MDNRKNHEPIKQITGDAAKRTSSAETRLAQLLEGGMPERIRPETEAPRRLSPRYEVRIVTERDPVMEETRIYREMAEEIDGRYDRFAPRKGE